jgi:aminopeptidase N
MWLYKAMENWGLITYREKYILFNPNYDSILNKKWVSVVVAHELAHQWVFIFKKNIIFS